MGWKKNLEICSSVNAVGIEHGVMLMSDKAI